MLKNVLESIVGIDVYPIISLALFGLFFSAVLLWVYKLDIKTVSRMENLPLEDK